MLSLVSCFLVLFLVLGASSSSWAQEEEYPSEVCAKTNKLSVIAQYDLSDQNQDYSQPRRRLIESYFYDKAGRNTRWRQYEVHDSTKYSDRDFTYDATGQHVKMAEVSADGTDGIIDSVRTDTNGFVAYRKLYRPSGEVLVEMWMTTEVNARKQPVKIVVFDKQKQPQGYTTFTYNTANKLLKEASFSKANVLQRQQVNTYHPNGAAWQTSELKGSLDTVKTKVFTSTGLLLVETNYSQEMRGAIDDRTVRKYDNQQREVEQITYSNNFLPGEKNKLVASRREVSQYGASCLKSKTLIYSIDTLSGEVQLVTTFVYRYEFYP